MGRNHSYEDDLVYVYDDGSPSAPTDHSVSQEYFISKDLYLKSYSVKEHSLMNTYSSSPPYSLSSTVCNAWTCNEDTPCSSDSLYDELNIGMTHDSDISTPADSCCTLVDLFDSAYNLSVLIEISFS